MAESEPTVPSGDYVNLPEELGHLRRSIEHSREVLALPPDWDGEGAAAYEEETWRRAVAVIVRHGMQAWKGHRIRIAAPQILPGPKGSIDLHWETDSYELLLNIPGDANGAASFYGDNAEGMVIRGILNPAKTKFGLTLWLMQE